VPSRDIPPREPIRSPELLEPLVEPELAFIVQEELPIGLSVDDLLYRVHLANFLEIPESRFANWFPRLSYEVVGHGGRVSDP